MQVIRRVGLIGDVKPSTKRSASSSTRGAYDIAFNTELQSLIAERRYRFVLNGHTSSHAAVLRLLVDRECRRTAQRAQACVHVRGFRAWRAATLRHPAGDLSLDLTAWREERQTLGSPQRKLLSAAQLSDPPSLARSYAVKIC
jgi:hypothetical protein